ncbi:MAG: ABC transporter ATP-binding protein [Betaproteobacteria bacterium]|nr:MAG: ABC transporter ATP-binding protein [Betaproteobacteria bacterium]
MTAALEFFGLSKRYGAIEAVSSLSLRVNPGETFGLVGENGAGKTTLIKCLLDFCAIDGGSISIFGVPSERTDARSRLAFLPERFVPPHYLTSRDFLHYMARMYGRDFDLPECINMLTSLGLEPGVLARPVRSLSKGMIQKIGLAGCLLSARELLVLDEPTSGLDPRARALFKAAIRSARTAGRTIFLTSHSLADVDEMCDQIGVMHQGALLYSGGPVQLKRQYDAISLEQAFLKCIGET